MSRVAALLLLCLLAGAAGAQALHDPTRPPAGAPAGDVPPPARPAALEVNFIISAPERRLARVNQVWVAEGDTVAGARVVRIGPDYVRLRRDGVLLHIPLGGSRVSKRPADEARVNKKQ